MESRDTLEIVIVVVIPGVYAEEVHDVIHLRSRRCDKNRWLKCSGTMKGGLLRLSVGCRRSVNSPRLESRACTKIEISRGKFSEIEDRHSHRDTHVSTEAFHSKPKALHGKATRKPCPTRSSTKDMTLWTKPQPKTISLYKHFLNCMTVNESTGRIFKGFSIGSCREGSQRYRTGDRQSLLAHNHGGTGVSQALYYLCSIASTFMITLRISWVSETPILLFTRLFRRQSRRFMFWGF